MTSDDIIRMAREAGYGDAMSDIHAPALERFAELVAQAEREACIDLWKASEIRDDQIVELIEAAVAAERESIIQMFEGGYEHILRDNVAHEIRERSSPRE